MGKRAVSLELIDQKLGAELLHKLSEDELLFGLLVLDDSHLSAAV